MAIVQARVLATKELIYLQESFLVDGIKKYKDTLGKDYMEGQIELVSINGRKVNWAVHKLKNKPKIRIKK